MSRKFGQNNMHNSPDNHITCVVFPLALERGFFLQLINWDFNIS